VRPKPGIASAEARAFIAANATGSLPVPSASTIAEFRDDSASEFRVRAERMLTRLPVRHRECVVAGIPCIEVVPTDSDPAATLLYCYGGGFVCGSAFEDLIISAPLATFANLRIVAPKYRLAPEHPWPAAVDDGYAVYRDLLERTAPGRLAIAGESAGGNLALAILLRARGENLGLPAAAALLSPWCDLEHGGDSLEANDGRDPTLSRAWVEAAARLYCGTRDAADPDISPINGAFDATFPPVLITTGTRDLLMSQCVRLAGVLRRAEVPVDLHVWDSLWHVFEFYDEIPEADVSLREIARFLQDHLPSKADAS